MKTNNFKILLFFTMFISIFNMDILYAKDLNNVFKIEPTEIGKIAYKSIYYEDVGVIDSANNYTLPMQGVYFFEKNNNAYAIYAGTYTAKNPEQADKAENDLPNVMTLVDLGPLDNLENNTPTIIARTVSNDIMGHANDITYDEKNDLFYVSGGDKKKIFGFKINLKNKIIYFVEPTNASFISGAIGYDNDHQVLYYLSNNKFHEAIKKDNEGFIKNKTISDEEVDIYYDNIGPVPNIKLVVQELDYSNGNIYFARTVNENLYDSYVLVFDAETGIYKYSMNFSGEYYPGHLEGITVIGNTIYFGLNGRKSTKGNICFLKYEGIDDLEEKYNRSIKKGDVNGDKTITIIDVRLLLQAYINSTTETKWGEDQLVTMDMDEDNKIDIIDVRLLLQKYINL